MMMRISTMAGGNKKVSTQNDQPNDVELCELCRRQFIEQRHAPIDAIRNGRRALRLRGRRRRACRYGKADPDRRDGRSDASADKDCQQLALGDAGKEH